MGLGSALLVSKKWEISGAYHDTISGVSAAKGWEIALALTYRPYSVPDIKPFEEPKIAPKETAAKWMRQETEVQYGFIATILKVSEQGNFFKIELGGADQLKVGDQFHVFKPANRSSPERKLIAIAKVIRVENHEAFLRVEKRFLTKEAILPGFEAQRIISIE
jgi:hypothetical protein